MPLDKSIRAGLYLLLARFLDAPPERPDLEVAGGLACEDVPALGESLAAFAAAARSAGVDALADEYHRLFIGVGGGELTPYASYYLYGSLHDRALVDLRQTMARIGLRSATSGDPEDHVAAVFEIMAALLMREGEGDGEARRFFEAHVAGWSRRFFNDLAAATREPLYAAAGQLGAAFMELERDASAAQSVGERHR